MKELILYISAYLAFILSAFILFVALPDEFEKARRVLVGVVGFILGYGAVEVLFRILGL